MDKKFILVVILSAFIAAVTVEFFHFEKTFFHSNATNSFESTAVASSHSNSSDGIFLIPEHGAVDAVVVSELLISSYEQGLPFLLKLLENGERLIVLTTPIDASADEGDQLDVPEFAAFQKQITYLSIPHSSVWLRDFGAFAFLNDIRNGSPTKSILNFTYRSRANLDDTVPYMLGLYLENDVKHLNLELDGGNFISDGYHCYSGRIDEKARIEALDNFNQKMTQRAGCKSFKILPDAPHEHIDMFAKFTRFNHLFINKLAKIDQNVLDGMEKRHAALYLKTQNQLDAIAQELSAKHKIVRLPQPTPFGGIFRTYSNSLIVNGTAYVPSYRKDFDSKAPYPDHDLLPDMEKQVERLYNQAGLNVVFVDSDEFIASGGALHCVAITIPRSHLKQISSRATKNHFGRF